MISNEKQKFFIVDRIYSFNNFNNKSVVLDDGAKNVDLNSFIEVLTCSLLHQASTLSYTSFKCSIVDSAEFWTTPEPLKFLKTFSHNN